MQEEQVFWTSQSSWISVLQVQQETLIIPHQSKEGMKKTNAGLWPPQLCLVCMHMQHKEIT